MAGDIIIASALGAAFIVAGVRFFRESREARGLDTGLDDYLPSEWATDCEGSRGVGGCAAADRLTLTDAITRHNSVDSL